MIRCKDVATLLSTDRIEVETPARRLAVAVHLAICRPCRRFRRQLIAMHHAAARIDAGFDAELDAAFADRLQERVTGQISDK